MKNISTQAQKQKMKKLREVLHACEESEYAAVGDHFRDVEHLGLVGAWAFALQRFQGDVMADLQSTNDEVDDDDVQSSVLDHLLTWTDRIDFMIKVLGESRDRAWEIFDELYGVDREDRN